MNNSPNVKLGIVGVSRDCFPAELTKKRKQNVVDACKKAGITIEDISVVIENENDMKKALKEVQDKGVNAVVIYLGNFGPEGPTSLFVQNFPGPVMACAAAEETQNDLINGRGDAYCGMLNLSYNLGLRKKTVHIPEYPVGMPDEIARMIGDFIPTARVILGLKSLKVFGFGPRPHDFLACNAPIKPMYDLGIEVMENSELDLLDIFKKAEGHKDIPAVAADMEKELGKGNTFPKLLPKLAQYEIALKTFMQQNLGASQFGIFANKCWPSFESFFGFVPCYVNSRLGTQGIPVACEVDLYGAVSEYMCYLASGTPATLLDINNTVPYDMVKSAGSVAKGMESKDMFMGFHCGNTPSSCLKGGCSMKYQLIMHRLMEPTSEPNITRGTLEGQLKPGECTVFRLQGRADTSISSYIAQGDILDIDPKSFGGIGVIAIKDLDRFYRHVLIGKNYPHHSAVAFKHVGRSLFAALKMLGVADINTPRPAGMWYPNENVF